VPFSPKRPARGPTTRAPMRPAMPPLMCTTPPPAKSITRPSAAPPQLLLPLCQILPLPISRYRFKFQSNLVWDSIKSISNFCFQF
jgi:hypothetical protein